MKIRPTTSEDIPALTQVVDGTALFPSEMLPDLLSAFLSGDESESVWLTAEEDGNAIGFCFASPEDLTDGTWNMLALAVLPAKQGKGVGGAIVAALEKHLAEQGKRLLIVDTSGTDDFAQTREFYRKHGYTEEARIRDFWAAGDDKIVFWKAL
ncbi:MAG: GNAT family N-acetyltransferase [Pseudomonadota bacterium]